MKLKKNESVVVGAKKYVGEIPDAVAIKVGLMKAPVEEEKPAKAKGSKKK